MAISRVAELLEEINGAEAGQIVDVNSTKQNKKIIKFDSERFKKFVGLDLGIKTCQKYLENLGFKIKVQAGQLLVEPPAWRLDIQEFEDVAEEVIRFYGYNKLKSSAPKVHLNPSGFEDQIVLKDKIRKVLTGLGLNEVSNYSFVGESDKQKSVELENPMSAQLKYLRASLAAGLIENINTNFRFFDEVKIFEIGKVFGRGGKGASEKLMLGIVFASKKNKQAFFELKGVLEQLFKKIGLVEYLMSEGEFADNYLIPQEVLKIESGGLEFGYLGRVSKNLIGNNEAVLAEINLEKLLKLVEEEHEYQPLPKYPSVMRDISILVEPNIKVGDIMQSIQECDLKYIDDVDLIDEFELEGKRSLTLRIVFQAQEKTLTDKEVNIETEKIVKMLKNDFNATIR